MSISKYVGRFGGACVSVDNSLRDSRLLISDNADGLRLARVIDPSGLLVEQQKSSIVGQDLLVIQITPEVDRRLALLVDLCSGIRYQAASIVQLRLDQVGVL